ncbi:variant erythrocyte surface antigen-1 family protein, partial [Babesia divergens]
HCKVRMFFISSCPLGCLSISLCLSVPRTLRSVLTGFLEPLGRIMVCYMYYTDVFVGTDNIDNLNNALKAELKESGLNDLTQLVHGLCLFMGYPSCLCKPKKSVGESLKKISKELKEELKNYKCLLKSISKPSLNCSSCFSSVVCKCCVLDCIREVLKCLCVKGGSGHTCSCIGDPKRCCKDLLEKLKASLSLLNLKTDMEKLCTCPDDCCVKGECTKGSPGCKVCPTSKASKDYTITGLGLLRPSPKRLAEKLEGFFGNGPKGSCSCQCGSGPSCCCLACQSCSASCNSECRSSGSCLHPPKPPSDCPRKTFCEAIKDIKIPAQARDRTCCESGQKCHCEVDKKCQATSTSSSGQKCCIERSGQNYKHSVKCMIRRLVSYFKSLQYTSSPEIKNFKNCCELLCVIKTCEFLKMFYDKRNLNECSKCKNPGKGAKGGSCPSNGKCCEGSNPQCPSGSTGTLCSTCSECRQICDSKKFFNELQTLQYSGPCGQELYRTLDAFIQYCCYVFYAKVKDLRLEDKIKTARNKCGTCQKSGKHSSCSGCKDPSGSSCDGCTETLKKLEDHKDVLSLMTRGYSSAYSSEASWTSLPSSGSVSEDEKKAAKIFLGMLPCLYYALQYLYDRCNGGWSDQNISNQDKPLRRFLVGMGYDVDKELNGGKTGQEISSSLSSLFTSSNGPLKKLYDVSQKYFPSPSLLPSSDSKPETVRDILLWLSGLPFSKGFEALLEHCKRLCKPVENSVKFIDFDNFKASLFDSCFLSPFVLAAIEDSEEAFKNFPPYKSEISKFSYPEDPSALLEKLCEYTRKVFPPLKFLCMQCELDNNDAGWKDCAYGQGCAQALKISSPPVSSSPSGCTSCSGSNTYLCTAINKDTVHDGHCLNGQCLGSDSCTQGSGHSSATNCTPCPHPLLRFLLDGSKDSEDLQHLPTPFKSPEGFPPMGFSKENLPSPGRKGEDLFFILDIFVGKADSDNAHPVLRDLLRFLLCLTRTPPETLGELFVFFQKFKDSSVLHSKLKDFADYVDGEPGTYSGEDLKTAVRGLYGSKESHSGSHSHSNDLYSLYDCSTSTCGKYLYPLIQDASDIFGDDFIQTYLS